MKEFDNEIVIFSPTLTIAFPHAEFGYMCEEDAYGFYMQAQGRFLSPRNRMRYLTTTPKMKLFEESKAHFPRLPSLENS